MTIGVSWFGLFLCLGLIAVIGVIVIFFLKKK